MPKRRTGTREFDRRGDLASFVAFLRQCKAQPRTTDLESPATCCPPPGATRRSMGSFDSSNPAGFTTKPLVAKQLTATINGVSGSFVKLSLTERATLATFRPLATDNAKKATNNEKCRDRRQGCQRCHPFAASSM